MRRFPFAALAGSAVLLVAMGCGERRHTPVTGLVTLDGQPYGNVLITFLSVDDGGSVSPVGAADDSGNFQMGTETRNNGVKPGKYKVTVSPGPPKDAKPAGHPSEAFLKKAPPAGSKVDANKEYKKVESEATRMSRKTPSSIYADPARTPLPIVEVTNEPKNIKLELKSNPQ
jgi:hypothetical protein